MSDNKHTHFCRHCGEPFECWDSSNCEDVQREQWVACKVWMGDDSNEAH